MSSKSMSSEISWLFKQTKIRYPNQQFGPETLDAWMDDWETECRRVGWKRFKEGVEGARAYSEFFPMIATIRKFIPEPRDENLRLQREMADLKRRKEAGEKFYCLADVLKEFCWRVESGEIKGRDAAGHSALVGWANAFRGSEEEYARRMLSGEREMAKGAGA